MRVALKCMIALCTLRGATLASAKGDNDLGANFSYLDGKGDTEDGVVHSTQMTLSGMYLRNLKSYWIGGELTYDAYRSEVSTRNTLVLGVPVKYWLKGPESKGVGFYGFVTPYFGKLDNGLESGTVMGLKLGPALVVFLSDMLGVDTKIVYDYRKTGGKTSTTTGLLVGFSVYF